MNSQTNQYEPCYSQCEKCNELGDINDNKCTECKDGYSLIQNKNNKINCYSICSHYFYFDQNNEYVCLSDDNYPTNYKLIYGKGKCIDNCVNDIIYNYIFEYKNVCYQTCPTYTQNTANNLCELKCEIFNKYYNYDQTDCIDNILEGFYLCNLFDHNYNIY